ncbi:MAG: S41 family peptidase [Bacteroides sp.]|jgi:hypothetical protein|nr:S41 family peptidase [Bacteroides sp.]
MKTFEKSLLVILIFLLGFWQFGFPQHLSYSQLVADARQLSKTIENCHPDPYMNMQGKIGYHLTLDSLLSDLPPEGMEADDFWWVLSGFLAKIEDGHTFLFPLKYPDTSNPHGIPLYFSVLADSSMVISKVCNAEHIPLIGSKVQKINGEPVDRLLEKVASLYPMENLFDRFRNLRVYLWYSDYLERLLPGWSKGVPIEMELRDKSGNFLRVLMDTGGEMSYRIIEGGSSMLPLPDVKQCDFVFDWIGEGRDVGYLRLEKQDEFKEYAEQAISGLTYIQDDGVRAAYRNQYLTYAKIWYERYYGSSAPDSLELIIEKLPSFASFMQGVVTRMKEKKTKTLIIDLRNNRGGVSLMSEMLVYFLFGKEHLYNLHKDSYEVTFLSPLAIDAASSLKPELINESRGDAQRLPLQAGDYDFFSLKSWMERDQGNQSRILPDSNFESTTTFHSEYVSGKYAGYYCPENIFVVGSSETFSAGFETLVKLVKSGAIFVGVPPAQSGNCFGMGVEPLQGLTNSGIRFQVSVKKIWTFPEDKGKGYLLIPDIPTGYTQYRNHGCDPNTSILMILDSIAH